MHAFGVGIVVALAIGGGVLATGLAAASPSATAQAHGFSAQPPDSDNDLGQLQDAQQRSLEQQQQFSQSQAQFQQQKAQMDQLNAR